MHSFILHAFCIRFTLPFTLLAKINCMQWLCEYRARAYNTIQSNPMSWYLFLRKKNFALMCTQISSVSQGNQTCTLHSAQPMFGLTVNRCLLAQPTNRLFVRAVSSFQSNILVVKRYFHFFQSAHVARVPIAIWEIGKRAFKMVISHSIFYMHHITYMNKTA